MLTSVNEQADASSQYMSMEKPGQTFQEIGGQTALLLHLKSIQQQSTTLIEVHFRLQISIRAHIAYSKSRREVPQFVL